MIHYLERSDSIYTECGRESRKIMSAAIGGGADGVDCKQCLKKLAKKGIATDSEWRMSEVEAWKHAVANSMWSTGQMCKHVADEAQNKLLEHLIVDATRLYEEIGEIDFNFKWYIEDTLKAMLKQLEKRSD